VGNPARLSVPSNGSGGLIMGYYSDVAITLTGEAQEVKDLLNAYRLTETPEQIENAWHLLYEPNPDDGRFQAVRFFYEKIESNTPVVQLTWLFSGVKWYDESEKALHRLGDILEKMHTDEKNQALAITMARLGEQNDDFEENHWGENPFDYESPADLCRYFDVQAPVVEVNPIKQLFNNEGK
jgi:hypothetical protein